MNRAERRRAEKEIRKGGASKAVQDVYKSAWEEGSAATVYNMALLACTVLYEAYGFRKKRLWRFAQVLNAIGTGGRTLDEIEAKLTEKYPGLVKYLKGSENND